VQNLCKFVSTQTSENYLLVNKVLPGWVQKSAKGLT